jgi:cellulose synthase/poly-beta-1,6-N-acetylglucosamine synthase-like glycosyltransferase
MMVVFIGFLKLSNFTHENLAPQTKFSVIIPFRNEAERLPNLLASIIGLRYPTHLIEVIFVDDASEDDSVAIIETALQDSQNPSEIIFKIIPNRRLSGSPKKDARIKRITQKP